MTSNIGTRQIGEGKTVGFESKAVEASAETMKKRILDELKKEFNPELLNRIDEMIIFHTLDMDSIKKIIDILITELAIRMAEKGISFTLSPKAKDFLAEKGYEPAYGARPLKRALQKYLEDPMAEEILRGQYAGDCDLVVGIEKDNLTFNFNPKKNKKESKNEEVAKP